MGLLVEQASKGYLGPEGDIGFFEALKPIIFGDRQFGDRVSGIQTPGGTGALRLAFELIARARPGARIWVGNPTWPNHPPILGAAWAASTLALLLTDAARPLLLAVSSLSALLIVALGLLRTLRGPAAAPESAPAPRQQ